MPIRRARRNPDAGRPRFVLQRFDPRDHTTRAERRRHGTTAEIQWRLFTYPEEEWLDTFSRRRDAMDAVRAVNGVLVSDAEQLRDALAAAKAANASNERVVIDLDKRT